MLSSPQGKSTSRLQWQRAVPWHDKDVIESRQLSISPSEDDILFLNCRQLGISLHALDSALPLYDGLTGARIEEATDR